VDDLTDVFWGGVPPHPRPLSPCGGEGGMVKRCENGEIGMFSLCQPLDISSVTGSLPALLVSRKGAKTQSQDKMFTFPALHLGALAPLREVKSWNRQTLESRQSGMFSSCLPVSLSPFHHPRARGASGMDFCHG
jgi:hypothetical protein